MENIDIFSIAGDILFSYECKDNTIKKTVAKAVKDGADLSHADLSHADLRDADLRYADLSYADLRDADLSGADLSCADLNNAYLSGCTLRSAKLISSNLSFSNMTRTDISNADLLGSNLSHANLSYSFNVGANFNSAHFNAVDGLNYASCSFTMHGKRGRQLLAVEVANEIRLFCGCFNGSVKELTNYINNDNPDLVESRLLALETVIKLFNFNLR